MMQVTAAQMRYFKETMRLAGKSNEGCQYLHGSISSRCSATELPLLVLTTAAKVL